jgi:hypothetical protein
LAAAFTAVVLTVSGAGVAQGATGGGGSSSGGSGGGLLDSASTIMIAQDGFNGVGQPTLQGRGQSSIDYFWNQTVSAFQSQLNRTPGSQGVQPGQTPRDTFNATCGVALQNAADRATAMGHPSTAAGSRVVGVYFSYAVGSVNWFMSSVTGREFSDYFSPSWVNEVTNPAAPGFAYDNDRNAYAGFQQDGVPALDAIAATWRAQVDSVIAANPSSGRYFTCVALNEFEPQMDFQPIVSSQVSLTRINKGQTQTDQCIVGVAAGDEWTRVNGQNIPVNCDWTVYGPLDQRAVTSMTIPAGAPVAARGTVVVNGPGATPFTWTPTASGEYAFVVEVKKSRQGANAQYIRSDARDAYFAPSESFTVRMSPQLSTQVVDKHSDDPDYYAADRVRVSLPAGDVWLAQNGSKLPLRVRVTAYGCVPVPTAPQATVPAGATVLGTRFLTYTGPGEQTIPAIPRTCDGAVTYVAEIRIEDQSSAMQAALSGNVRDWYMLVPETTYARHQIKHSSLAREYNVHIGGRAYDDVDLDGFPEDHGQWQGIAGWSPDLATAHVTVYRTTYKIETAEVPADATVLKRVTIPAVNGRHQIGYTDADKIQPYQSGYYVFVTCFDGDDRVAPFCSPANDIRETFYVPGENQPWVDMMSTATQNAVAGEGTISDTALVTGQGAPLDGTMVWDLCLSAESTFPDCDQPQRTYSTPVTGSGFYDHPADKTPSIQDFPPGVLTAYRGWAPTLLDANGVVLDRENFGVPAQTTVIRAKVPDWTSKATATAGPGDTVSDVVTFDGETRSDWTTGWELCWLDEDLTCPEGASFTVGKPVQVDPASDTLQGPEWQIEIPAGTKPGTDLLLGHQPVLRDALGVELRREAWGTNGQVTRVHYPLPSMTSQATPKALIGAKSQDTVTIVGPVEAGSRMVWPSCYSNEANGPECRPDAIPIVDRPVNDDGTVGLVLPELAVGEELVVQSPEHTLTYGGMAPDLGLRFSWQPKIVDPDGNVMIQEATGLPNQTTVVEFPPIELSSQAFHIGVNGTDAPMPGDQIGDLIRVARDILPGDQAWVELFTWPNGSTPVCTGEPLAKVTLKLKPGVSEYSTGPIYTMPADKPGMSYGFVHTSVSRGVTETSECGLASETVVTVDPQTPSAHGALAVTGAQIGAGVLAVLALLTNGHGLLSRVRQRRQGSAT